MPIQPTKDAVPPTPETALKATPPFLSSLPPEMQAAAIRIEAGWRLVCRGVVVRPAKFHRVGGKMLESNVVEGRKARIERSYLDWCAEMGSRALGTKPVILAVVDGLPPYEIDRQMRRPMGWAAERLIEGLTLYCKLQQRAA